jgi:uncharacterized protein (UPF0332 family)
VVASLVNEEHAALLPLGGLWGDHEEDRARSAISRAYYAAFRSLKHRLMTARAEWRTGTAFPDKSIHKKIAFSLERALTGQHALTIGMKALLRQRNRADYSFAPPVSPDDADSEIIVASDLVAAIEALSDTELSDIALELRQVDAAWSSLGRTRGP